MQKLEHNGVKRRSYLSLTAVTTLTTIVMFAVVAACTDKQAKAKPNFVQKDAPKPGVVAKINGQEITEEELIGDDKLDFFDLKKREYELKMDRLNRLLIEKLVGTEAKKANMSVEDFINKNVAKGGIKISDKDYKKFVAEKRIPEAQITPQIKERIMAYMENQKRQEMVQEYIAKLTKSNPVEVYFKKPKMEVNVEIGQSPVWGKGKVTIVEFSDFQCPFCSRAAETVNELKKKYGTGKIKLAFRHFPLPMHKDAKPAAEASMCVNEQSTDKFWKFHDLAFKNQDKLDTASITKYAKDAGADMKKFDECFKAGKYRAQIEKDLEYGEKIGVKSTPTFFINGQIVSGAVPLENFSEVIDDELANAK